MSDFEMVDVRDMSTLLQVSSYILPSLYQKTCKNENQRS